MRKIVYILSLLILLSGILNAQQNSLHQALNEFKNGNLLKAGQLIDEASNATGTSKEAQTWYYKGIINKELYKSKESSNTSSEFRKTSIAAYIQCISLDVKKEYLEDCKKSISFLASTVYNDAAKEMNNENYKKSFINFEYYLEIKGKTEPEKIDTLAVFHAGYTAYMDKNYSKAIVFLNKAKNLNYPDPLLYYFLGKSYWNSSMISEANNIFLTGSQIYPSNKKLTHVLINFYQETGKDAELVKLLTREIPKDPGNIELKYLLGATYERLLISDTINKKEYNKKAREVYNELLKEQPDNFRVNYNMGLLFYNDAVDIINRLDYDTEMVALEDIQEECKELFKKALPYMEKAYQLSPKNKETLKGLQGIYFSLHDIENTNKIKSELDSLEKN